MTTDESAAPTAPIPSEPSAAPKPSKSAPAPLTPRISSPVHTNHANGHATRPGDSLPNLGDMDAKCGGCRKTIDQESSGIVVAFGSSLWHVDCFRCAKCRERVSADTNLLLLSDGNPVCANCSYQCFVCKQAITAEAIMTGDESYHAHCFTCRTCKRRIEELVFAKTSQGIYCMACHNERVARSRRHAEAKRQRAARKEKERDQEDGSRQDELRQQSASPVPSGAALLASPAIPSTSSIPSPSPLVSPNATTISVHCERLMEATGSPHGGTPDIDAPHHLELSVERSAPRSDSPIAKAAQDMPLPVSPSDRSPQPRNQNASLGSSQSLDAGSPSFGENSSARGGLNVGLGVGPVGLGVPTSKAERRRSIYPAMTFNMDAHNSIFAAEPRLSPLPPSPLRASFTGVRVEQPVRSPTSPTPSHLGAESFPFRTSAAGPSVSSESAARTSSDDHRPPRTSSLPDQLSASRSRPLIAEEDETADSMDAPPQLPPKLTPVQNIDVENSTPRLLAPDLPPMTFSLSDPDFALILNHIDRSPPKESPIPRTGDPGHTIKPDADGSGSVGSRSSSPHHASSAALARSPQMDMLSSAVETEGSSRSLSRTRLSPNDQTPTPQLLRTRQPSTESTTSVASKLGRDSAFAAIVEMVATNKHIGHDTIPVDLNLLSGIVAEVEDLKDVIAGLTNKYTGAKRTSQQYSEGLTVAGEEYDKELAHRRELEAEVKRLRAQVHSQTARLSVISGDERREENMRRRSHDLANSLTGLERDISKLRAQRDMTLAEVEELNASRKSLDGSSDDAASMLSRSLTRRLDTIKEQYREELEPLTAQREALQREIADLREMREQFLEESTALAAKNEELAELNAQLSRQVELLQDSLARGRGPTIFSKGRSHPSGSPSLSSLATSAILQEVPEETARVVKVTRPEPIEAAPARRFKWYKSSKGPDLSGVSASISKPLGLPSDRFRNMQRPSTEFGVREHAFQQHSTMRFTRCELCQEKMWGLQEVRCASCGMVCHSKCAEKLPRSCSGRGQAGLDLMDGSAMPSLFGRELVEQVAADKTAIPVIVLKSISAVEAVGMEYEGIYRKTGGSSQSKQITQLFERGDYESFDLADVETFNDISSVTSVLKTYFRQLPDPLLTHALHESFVAAASIRDANNKHSALCALLKELPKEHYDTLRALMLHLNRVTAKSSLNLMTSQNLGVVFGPTLMRSSDPNREFGDMAGKALSIQWMVDHAPQVFTEVQGV